METKEKTRGQAAKEYFLSGYNCAQAVALSFSDIIPLDKENLLKMSSSFGGGMGRLREVCGAVSGMFIVLGFVSGYSDAKAGEQKSALYAGVQELAKRFSEENGAIICRELLGLEEKQSSPAPEKRTAAYYKKRPCAELCEAASNILENYLKENDIL